MWTSRCDSKCVFTHAHVLCKEGEPCNEVYTDHSKKPGYKINIPGIPGEVCHSTTHDLYLPNIIHDLKYVNPLTVYSSYMY